MASAREMIVVVVRQIDAADVLGLVGFIVLEAGLVQVSPPLAWIVGGVILMALAVMPFMRSRGRR